MPNPPGPEVQRTHRLIISRLVIQRAAVPEILWTASLDKLHAQGPTLLGCLFVLGIKYPVFQHEIRVPYIHGNN